MRVDKFYLRNIKFKTFKTSELLVDFSWENQCKETNLWKSILKFLCSKWLKIAKFHLIFSNRNQSFGSKFNFSFEKVKSLKIYLNWFCQKRCNFGLHFIICAKMYKIYFHLLTFVINDFPMWRCLKSMS